MQMLEGKEVPDHIMKVINEEMKRFASMDKHNSEAQVSKTYLEYLCKLPHGVKTDENFDLKLAR